MDNANAPVYSTKTLIKASVIAVLMASVIFITVILPAEYNIDPTGLGEAIGLTQLAAQSSTSVKANQYLAAQLLAEREDSTLIMVPPGGSLEYKLHLKKYGVVDYSWSVDNGELYFDFHGEPQNDASGYFESYTVSTAHEIRGKFTAPFTGSHGWYWKNNGFFPAAVTLKTHGYYEVIGTPK